MQDDLRELAEIFAKISSEEEMSLLMEELFTANELELFVKRWRLLKKLYAGETQREIAAELGLSLCKITRGAKELKKENSIMRKILEEKETKK